jgi:urease accessory protein
MGAPRGAKRVNTAAEEGAACARAWSARLQLNYAPSADGLGPVTVRHQHDGPLRVLKSLYPEGPGTAHNVLVHPPGGLVEGDALDIDVQVATGAHGLVSTPGATRFYRSAQGGTARQSVRLQVAAGARLEWLPLETLAYPGCRARNELTFSVAEGGSLMAWDVLALGLPAAQQPFTTGRMHQRMEWPGVWRDEAVIDAADTLLLAGAQGLAGQRCMGTLVWASGDVVPPPEQERLLEPLRAALELAPPSVLVGATWCNERVLVVRALAPLAEPLSAVFRRAWAVLRREAWGLDHTPPRIWAV